MTALSLASDRAVASLCDTVMRAVVKAGAVRSFDQDGDLAIKIMREELKSFLFDAKYADERALVVERGNQQLAVASLVAECVQRIIAERRA